MKRQFLNWSKTVSQDALFQWMEPEKPLSTSVEAACVCKSQDDNELCSEGSNCLNRITETYCTHHACKNQMPNECPDILIHNFGSKGWGLKSTRTIPSGTFVCQYLGTTLNEATVRKQGESNYLLRLGDIFLDAKQQGNQARFLNHSCDPNCDLLKRNDGDRPCAIIITNREILRNNELTINYRWTSGVECLCGAPNCTKVIGRSSKERSQDRLNRDDDDSLRLNDSTQTPRLRSSLKRLPSPSPGESRSKRPRQAQLDVPPVLSTSCGKSYASDVGGLPNNQDKNNYQQSTMRRPEARHKDQTILHEPPASLGNRPDPRSPSAVSSPRNDDSYFTILRVLKCNLSKFQKRCNERKGSRTSGVAKPTDEPAPNLNDPTSIASHAIANPSALTLGPVSSTRDKTASPASSEVSGAGGTELILDNRGSNARSLDSSGELINGPDGVLVAETMIGGLRKERSQDRAILNNNEELLLNSVIPPESSATDRVGPHASDVGGSLQECGIDSCQQVKKRQTRETLEPDDRQTERCEITPFTPSSPVQASFNRSPQPTASFESELLATFTIIKRHHTNPNFSSLSATTRGSRSKCDPRHHSGLEEVRDMSAVNSSTQKWVPLPAQPANSAAFHHIHAGDPDVERSSAMHGLPASSSPIAGSDANGENNMLHHLIERSKDFDYPKSQLSTFRSSSQPGPSESQGPLSALQTDNHDLRLAPILADMGRRHQSELPKITQLVKLPANPNDLTSISSQAPDDSGPFACGGRDRAD
ncbi:hypothetical protein PG985_005452 [Apiospora marii]|uniref:uncharacterized protein n=1 Tax=Apiospora marii TaxID=335849 RepID=UPI0031309085